MSAPRNYEEACDLLEASLRNIPPCVTPQEEAASRVYDAHQGELWKVEHGDLAQRHRSVTVHEAGDDVPVVPESAAWRGLLKKQAEAYARGEAAYQATIAKLTEQNAELKRVAHGAVKGVEALLQNGDAIVPGGHKLSKRVTHWNTRLAALEE